jgi:intracellular multiplication protein IcmL
MRDKVTEMSDEEMQIVGLRDDFYRDSFKKVLAIVLGAFLVAMSVAALATYYAMSKPWPVAFAVGPQWQVQPPVSISRPFVSKADLLQWTSDVVPALFTMDFLNYDAEIAALARNFTANGWHIYQNQLKNFAAKDVVIQNHTFISAKATDVPAIVNRGLLSGRYAWLITLPLEITYNNLKTRDVRSVTFQVLVVRVPTEKNLIGIAIDDIVVAKSA